MTRAAAGVAPEICLVTSGNVATNPRLVKEASALRNAGYAVRIVAADIIPSLAPFDAEIISRLGCEFTKVDYRKPAWKRAVRAFRQRVARKYIERTERMSPRLAVLAHHPLTPALTDAALRGRANLYIAHNLAALPAAGTAASHHRVPFGFDAEDYHCGELEDTDANHLELRIRRAIESHWLPQCKHLTSASPGISEAYATDYGVEMLPILNVFPLSEAPTEPMRSSSMRGELPSLYWFSQTIGGNRGLEQIVAGLALMRTRVDLFLRGNPSPGYIGQLLAIAQRVGGDHLAKRIKILPVASPAEMVKLSAEYDLGLAVEPGCNKNNQLALSNKAFTYLLGGVPVLLSRTSAQTQLAAELGSAALLVDLSKPQQIADVLDAYFSDRPRHEASRAEAWRLARARFIWDIERRKFVANVAAVLPIEAA
jgi:glycosyltransferase involved in cell wall biosynthesis